MSLSFVVSKFNITLYTYKYLNQRGWKRQRKSREGLKRVRVQTFQFDTMRKRNPYYSYDFVAHGAIMKNPFPLYYLIWAINVYLHIVHVNVSRCVRALNSAFLFISTYSLLSFFFRGTLASDRIEGREWGGSGGLKALRQYNFEGK